VRVLVDGRVRRTRAERQRLLEQHGRSGLSVSDFCRREKVSKSAFTRWRREAGGTFTQAPTFVELTQAQASPARLPRGTGEFEISLPGGVVLRWTA
jgi:transposase-like protein